MATRKTSRKTGTKKKTSTTKKAATEKTTPPKKEVVEKAEAARQVKAGVLAWQVVSLALAILLVASIATGGFGARLQAGTGIAPPGEILSPEEIVEKTQAFIDEHYANPQAGLEIKVLGAEDVGDLYKVPVKVSQFGITQNVTSYVTKDGRLLFVQGVNMTEEEAQERAEEETTTQEEQQAEKTSGFDAPDKERAEMKFFVMSFCPFGKQAEQAISPVARLMGDKAIIEPHYVIYSNYGGPNYCYDEEQKYCSMHGKNELLEDIRQMIIWKEYDPDTWWDYVDYVNANCSLSTINECWKKAAHAAGINTTLIEEKMNDTEYVLSLLAAELELNKQYGVTGSPTVFINDQTYRGARTPQAYLDALCSGYTTQPEECNETLSQEGGTASGQC